MLYSACKFFVPGFFGFGCKWVTTYKVINALSVIVETALKKAYNDRRIEEE